VLRFAARTTRERVAPGNAIAATQDRLSTAENVIRHADTRLPITLIRVHEATPHFVAGDGGVFGSAHEPSCHRVEIRLPVSHLYRRREVLVAHSDVESETLCYPEIVLHVSAVLPFPLAGNAQEQRSADAARITQDEASHRESGIRIDRAPG